jgi:hypothetical protein
MFLFSFFSEWFSDRIISIFEWWDSKNHEHDYYKYNENENENAWIRTQTCYNCINFNLFIIKLN